MAIVTKLAKILNSILGKILFFLPNSPFLYYINNMQRLPVIKYIGWLVPFQTIIAISETWLLAITTFYIFSAILRWVKAIE